MLSATGVTPKDQREPLLQGNLGEQCLTETGPGAQLDPSGHAGTWAWQSPWKCSALLVSLS